MCLVCIESGKSGFRTPKQIDGTVGRSLELGQTQAGFRLPNKLFTSTMWSVESRDMSPLSPPRDCFKCTSVCGQGWQGVLLDPRVPDQLGTDLHCQKQPSAPQCSPCEGVGCEELKTPTLPNHFCVQRAHSFSAFSNSFPLA
jgi:hypothetical protein